MHDIFATNKTEAVLLDAEKAFNSINKQVFLHNIKRICPPIAAFVRKYQNVPIRLYELGGKELLSHEGTTQGDPTTIAVCGIALTPPLKHVATCYPKTDPKMAFVDNLTSAGRLSKLHTWLKDLLDVGLRYG